jgi:hypothetical protein
MAVALRDWLPLILHYCDPWLSQRDIAAGERWAVEIGKELEGSHFGVIVITADNLTAPWILFEAGALSKAFTASAVCPYLVDLEFKELTGPLAQFQAKKADRISTLELVQSINAKASQPIDEARLRELFDVLWAKLDERIRDLPLPKGPTPPSSRPQTEIIEELVETIRRMENRLDLLNGSVERLGQGPAVVSLGRERLPIELRINTPFPHAKQGTIVDLAPVGDVVLGIASALGVPVKELGRDWYLIDSVTKRSLSPDEVRATYGKAGATNTRMRLDVGDVPF